MEQNDLSLKAEINLYYDLYIPDGADSAPLLIAVHGYGAHKRYMMREAKLIAPEHFVIASATSFISQSSRKTLRRMCLKKRIVGWLSKLVLNAKW